MSLLTILIANHGLRLVEMATRHYADKPVDGEALAKAMLPVVSKAIKSKTASNEGLQDFLASLDQASIAKYLDDPALAATETAQTQGREVLRKLLGLESTKGVMIARLAQRTGLAPGIVGQLLPVVAMAALGSLDLSLTDRQKAEMLKRARERAAQSGRLIGVLGRVWSTISAARSGDAHAGQAVLGTLIESGVSHDEEWVRDAFET